MQITPTLQLFGIAAGVISAVIAFYKFVIRRPRLRLSAENTARLLDDTIVGTLNVKLENRGFRYAEDVYIRIRLLDWSFGEKDNNENSDEDGVSPEDDSSRDSDMSEDSDSQNQNKISNLSPEVSSLGVKQETDVYFFSPESTNHLFIDEIIPNNSKFDILSGRFELEPGETYIVKYEIGCRSHGPRKGQIELEAGYNEVQINSCYPRAMKAWKRFLRKISSDSVSYVTKSVGRALNVQISSQQVRYIHSSPGVTMKDLSEKVVSPTATLRVNSSLDGPRSVKATVLLYIEKENERSILGSISFRSYSLSPGDTWKTHVPQGKSELLSYAVEYEHSYHQNPLPIVASWEIGDEEPKISDEWSVECWRSDKQDLRGISIDNCELRGDQQQMIGHIPVAAQGEVTNNSPKEKTVIIVAKFYNKVGEVVTTPTDQIIVPPKDKRTINISADLSSGIERQIVDCDLVPEGR